MSGLGERTRRQVLAAARAALRDAAEQVLAASDADLPVGDPAQDPDPGFALVEHGSIRYSHDGLVATIRYEGPYAAKLHEAQSYSHPRGGKAKFLEDSLKEIVPRLEGIVAGKVRARVTREH